MWLSITAQNETEGINMSNGTVVTADQQFADRLYKLAVEYGWSGDLIEVGRFVDWVHEQFGLTVPVDYDPE